jgi:RING finger protein 121/175
MPKVKTVVRPGHEDHEVRHTLILFLIFATIVISQVVLVQWKKNNYISYMKATLFCLWLLPVAIFISGGSFDKQPNQNFILMGLWTIFSLFHFHLYLVASQKPLALSTPRKINRVVYLTYRLCFGIASIGGIAFFCHIIFFQPLFRYGILWIGRVGLLFVFYGLYFGLMGRDFAEFLSNQIATEMGYASKEHMPSSRRSSGIVVSDQACGICQDLFKRYGKEDEPHYKLSCGHHFHEACVRGWTIVGKKDICPVCAEKVELSQIFDSNIWARKSIAWSQLLDSLRYLLVWNPLLVLIMQIFIFVLD